MVLPEFFNSFKTKESIQTKQSVWLLLLQAILLIPVVLGYTLELIIGMAVIGMVFYFFNSIENAIILTPLFIYMPVTVSSSMNIQVSEIGIVLLILVYASTTLTSKQKRPFETPALFPILLFICAALLSLVNAKFITAGVKQVLRMVEAFIVVFYLTVNYIEKKETMIKALKVIIISGVLAALYGFYQFKVGGEMTMGAERRIFGLLGGGYGAFIGSSIVCAVSLFVFQENRWEKGFLVLSLPFLVVALLLHQGRAWFVGVFAALLLTLFLIPNRKSLFRFIALFLGVGTSVLFLLNTNLIGFAPKRAVEFATVTSFQFGLTPEENKGKFLSILTRFFLWSRGFGIFMKHPILGFGIGNLRFRNMITGELGDPSEEGMGQIDNQYLNVLVETGILGFVSWMGILFVLYKASRKLLDNAVDWDGKTIASAVIGSLVVFFLGGLFWCITVTHEMMVMFAFLMGLLYAGIRLQRQQ